MKTSKFILSLFFVGLLAVSIGSSYNVDPKAAAIVVLAVGALFSFDTSKTKGFALAVAQANPFAETQLQIKEIIKMAIYQHYGYNNDGTAGPSPREIPTLIDKLVIRRADLFQTRYLGNPETVFDFFDKAQDPNRPFDSNFTEASLPANKMYAIFGITGQIATGAAATDTADLLSFGAPGAGDDEILNALVRWECNTEKQFENQIFKELFINDDAQKNFFRLPRITIWEPSNSQKLTVRLTKAYGAAVHKFGKFSLVAYEIAK